jgi:hypothetical protein
LLASPTVAGFGLLASELSDGVRRRLWRLLLARLRVWRQVMDRLVMQDSCKEVV